MLATAHSGSEVVQETTQRAGISAAFSFAGDTLSVSCAILRDLLDLKGDTGLSPVPPTTGTYDGSFRYE